MIVIIAAAAENNALGLNNDLLWHLPDDFKRFKELTTGHYIVMGRKTFESFPKPLPNRTHVIITRQKKYRAEGCLIAPNLEEALQLCSGQEKVFIIGGGEIYQQSLQIADVIELTRVHHTFEADTFFPEIDPKIWQLTSATYHPEDEKHRYAFTFQTFIKKQ